MPSGSGSSRQSTAVLALHFPHSRRLPKPAGTGPQRWIFDDDYGEPADVIAFVEQLGPALRLTGLWGFEWSHSCSRPRLDAFGGGACLIDLATGKTVASISTNEWLTRTLADPDTAGEA